MELLLMFSIFCGLLFVASMIFCIGLGGVLLVDLICKTHIGRKACRWVFFEE